MAQAEYAASNLVDRHLADTARFRAIVTATREQIATLDLPLGSPAAGLDMIDIESVMDAWLQPRPDFELAMVAETLAGVVQ